jgi:protein-S-isoprenylcysteine O-methyltransferase Ste14
MRCPFGLEKRRKDSKMIAKVVLFSAFIVCFVCFAFRSLYVFLRHRSKKIADSRAWLVTVYVVMAFLWFGWFSMNFNDPFRIVLPLWVRYGGLSLFVLGVFLFLFSHMGLKGVKGGEKLVTNGIYSKIRNPMYIGFIIWIIGFPTFMGSIITLATSGIWIAHILYWKSVEEKELEEKFEEYKEYKKRTWF